MMVTLSGRIVFYHPVRFLFPNSYYSLLNASFIIYLWTILIDNKNKNARFCHFLFLFLHRVRKRRVPEL